MSERASAAGEQGRARAESARHPHRRRLLSSGPGHFAGFRAREARRDHMEAESPASAGVTEPQSLGSVATIGSHLSRIRSKLFTW